MKTEREKQLEIALLTEKLQRISKKKVVFVEAKTKKTIYDYDWDSSESDAISVGSTEIFLDSLKKFIKSKEEKIVIKKLEINKKEAKDLINSHKENWEESN